MRIEVNFLASSVDAQVSIAGLEKALSSLAGAANAADRALGGIDISASKTAGIIGTLKAWQRELDKTTRDANELNRALAISQLAAVTGQLAPGAQQNRSSLGTFMGGRTFSGGQGTGFSYGHARAVESSWAELAATIAKANIWAEKVRRDEMRQNNLLLDAARFRHAAARASGIGPAGGGAGFGSHSMSGADWNREGVRTVFPFGPDREGRDAGTRFWAGFFASGRRAGSGGGGGSRGGRGGDWRDVTIGESLGAIVPGGSRARGPVLAAAVGLGAAAVAPVAPALVGLLGSIPALATAGAGAIATLALAFGGLGKAIGGDKKAFDKLNESQQKFVLMMRSMIPFVQHLKGIVQAELLPALTRAFHEALSPTTIAMLEQGLAGMARSLGIAAEKWGQFLGSASFGQTMGPILQAGAHWMEVLTDAAIDFTDAMLVLGRASLPFTGWMIDAIAKGAQLLSTWMRGAEASGRLARGFDQAKEAIRLVGAVLVGLGRALFALSRALEPVGELLLGALANGLNRLADWLNRNRAALIDITTGALRAFLSILEALVPILDGMFRALNAVALAIGGWERAFRILFGLGIVLQLKKIAIAMFGVEAAAGAAAGVGAGGAATGGGVAALILKLRNLMKLSAAGIIVGITLAIYEKLIPDFKGKHYSGIDLAQDIGDKVFGVGSGPGGGKSGPRPANPYKPGSPLYVAWARGARGQKLLHPTVEKAKAWQAGHQWAANLDQRLPATDRGGLTLPTSFRPTHDTDGIAGYQPSVDIKTKVGQLIQAPENGRLYNRHFIPYKPGFGGWTVYYQGYETGQTYFITHLGSARPNGNYRKGAVIGTGGQQVGGMQHVHVGITVGAGATTSSNTSAFGTPPPFDTNVPAAPKPSIATAASRRSAALTALQDLRKAHALARQIKGLSPHLVTHTIDNPDDMLAGVTITGTVGHSLTKQESNLKKQIAHWEKQLAADRKFLLTHKHLTTKQVAQIRQRDREILDAINQGKTRLAAAAQARADAFDAAWDTLTDRAMAAFDEQTDVIFKAFDKETSTHVTPTEALIKQLTDTRTERDLNKAIDDAKKNLDDALAGIGSDTAQATLDRITEVIARYGMAMAIDKAQAAVLGGPVGNFGPDFLKELRDASTATPGTIDQKAIDDARRVYDDAVEDLRIYKLQPIAEAERDAYEESRAALRDDIEKRRGMLRQATQDQLDAWGKFLSDAGATAAQAYALFDKVWFALTGMHLPPLPGLGSAAGPTGGATGTYVPGTPITSMSGFQQATGTAASATGPNASTGGSTGPNTNTGGSGATAVAASGSLNLASVWAYNQPNQHTAINSAATGGGSITITEGDPNGMQLAIDAASRNVPYSIQVNGSADDTPETLAAKVAAAKAMYPGAESITLDLETPNFRSGAGSAASKAYAAAVNQAAGGTPLVISTEGISDFNYEDYATNPSTTFAPMSYWGDMTPRDVQTIVDMLVAHGIDPSKIIPIIAPGASVGKYPGKVSVFGPVPTTTTAATAAPASGPTGAIQATLQEITNQGITPTPAIVQAVIAAATTTESPLVQYGGGGGISMMADGGILTRPTLMVGGERGREAVIPLSDGRARSMLGGDVEVHLNVAPGMEWLRDFISVEVLRNARTVGLAQGKDADRRSRERRT